MKTRIILFAFLMVTVTSCVPVTKPMLTPTPMPTDTYTPVPLTPTPEAPTDMPTPLPEQSFMPIMTPDAVQVAHWKEYQTTLARCFLSAGGGCTYSHPESALCEWDILGRSGLEVYVWAQCKDDSAGGGGPLVIYLETDGSIRKAKFGGYKGLDYNLDLFPADVQQKIIHFYYIGDSLFHGRIRQMLDHLLYRGAHSEEPPLSVLSATPAP